ncbi:hypothetical protein BO99DRAFT_180771 [Aspergillus violaceofuscus CBS 115571]|uniref:Uncharacterized protein n=1 Tax=Aspergillus violaceofuscus (strain CBS 115571) TaxID=1450538 RepID=A0A2V5HGF4_ASPV1|nr:hypothetical protein BO99DRAFT_180771 [Aspergillus violaceofuscus CBS 115571]
MPLSNHIPGERLPSHHEVKVHPPKSPLPGVRATVRAVCLIPTPRIPTRPYPKSSAWTLTSRMRAMILVQTIRLSPSPALKYIDRSRYEAVQNVTKNNAHPPFYGRTFAHRVHPSHPLPKLLCSSPMVCARQLASNTRRRRSAQPCADEMR